MLKIWRQILTCSLLKIFSQQSLKKQRKFAFFTFSIFSKVLNKNPNTIFKLTLACVFIYDLN